MIDEFGQFWVYLQATPLLWLSVTLAAYVAAQNLFERVGQMPLFNPVLVAIVLVSAVLLITDTSYGRYFDGAQFVHFLLGPATVALAVPLYQHRPHIKRLALPMALALLAGSVTALVSAVALAAVFGASMTTVISLAPKSVTTPIAMGVTEGLGGLPALTAVLVILTGIIGAITATPLLNRLRVKDYRARGFAVGIAAHGIGTARAFQINDLAGTFAGIGMALNGVMTALIAPLLLGLWR